MAVDPRDKNIELPSLDLAEAIPIPRLGTGLTCKWCKLRIEDSYPLSSQAMDIVNQGSTIQCWGQNSRCKSPNSRQKRVPTTPRKLYGKLISFSLSIASLPVQSTRGDVGLRIVPNKSYLLHCVLQLKLHMREVTPAIVVYMQLDSLNIAQTMNGHL